MLRSERIQQESVVYQCKLHLKKGESFSGMSEASFKTQVNASGDLFMDYEIEKIISFKLNDYEYTQDDLQNWVKTVPGTIRQLEEKGDMDQLIKYKKQVKLVLHKLEEIKLELENGK